MSLKIIGKYVTVPRVIQAHKNTLQRKLSLFKKNLLYKKAQRRYCENGFSSYYVRPENFGAEIYYPDRESVMIKNPDEYKNLMREISKDVYDRFRFSKNILLYGEDPKKVISPDESFPVHTRDLPGMREKTVRHLTLKEPHMVAGLTKLYAEVLPVIEQRIYGSYVRVRNIAVVFTPVCVFPEEKSVKWHTDNHHRDTTKVMVYLNDVTKGTAPFTYLRHTVSHMPPKIPGTYPAKYPGGRVPGEVIEQYISHGYEIYSATGPTGTMILFDNNIIHKGNYGTEGDRIAIILELEPWLEKTTDYIQEYKKRRQKELQEEL